MLLLTLFHLIPFSLPPPPPPPSPPSQPSPVSFAQVLDIALGAAEGLAYLHGFPEPIIHRDIKPQNILISDKYQVGTATG